MCWYLWQVDWAPQIICPSPPTLSFSPKLLIEWSVKRWWWEWVCVVVDNLAIGYRFCWRIGNIYGVKILFYFKIWLSIKNYVIVLISKLWVKTDDFKFRSRFISRWDSFWTVEHSNIYWNQRALNTNRE